jgi:hypothetical protein
MKGIKHTVKIWSVMVALMLAASAAAEPVKIEFNVAGYGPPSGAAAMYSRTDSTTGVGLSFTASSAAAASIWWDPLDGFGVIGSGPNSYSNDEIEGDDRLTLRFDRPVHLLGWGVTDFFNEQEPNGANCPTVACYREWGAAQLEYSDGSRSLFQVFEAPEDNNRSTNGAFEVGHNAIDVVAIVFAAPGELFGMSPAGFRMLMEYAVASVTIDHQPPTTVPEPGTLGLMALGLAAVMRCRKERAR